MLLPGEMRSGCSAMAFLFCAVTPVIHTRLVCCKLTLCATRSAKVSAAKKTNFSRWWRGSEQTAYRMTNTSSQQIASCALRDPTFPLKGCEGDPTLMRRTILVKLNYAARE